MRRATSVSGRSRPPPPVGAPVRTARRPRATAPFHGVIRPGDTPLRAARRLLCLQYRIMADNRKAAAAGATPAAVHDLRVAIRRFRAALRLFRKALRDTPAPLLDRSLSTLTQRLGPIRDHEVRLAFLRAQAGRRGLADNPAFRRLLSATEKEQSAKRRHLKKTLASWSCRHLMDQMALFVRSELHERADADDDARALESHLAGRIRRICRRLAAQPLLAADASPEDVHALRKLARRARYHAEFGAPVLGRRARDLARHLKRLADALGDIHDLDVHLEGLANRDRRPLEALMTLLRDERERAWRVYRHEWRRLRRRKFRTRLPRGRD